MVHTAPTTNCTLAKTSSKTIVVKRDDIIFSSTYGDPPKKVTASGSVKAMFYVQEDGHIVGLNHTQWHVTFRPQDSTHINPLYSYNVDTASGHAPKAPTTCCSTPFGCGATRGPLELDIGSAGLLTLKLFVSPQAPDKVQMIIVVNTTTTSNAEQVSFTSEPIIIDNWLGQPKLAAGFACAPGGARCVPVIAGKDKCPPWPCSSSP